MGNLLAGLQALEEEELRVRTKHRLERQRLVTQIQSVAASEAACYSREVELSWQQQQQQALLMSGAPKSEVRMKGCV